MSFSTRAQVLTSGHTLVQWVQSTSATLSGANNFPWFTNLSRVSNTIPGATLPATFGAAPGGATYDRTTSGALVIPNAAAGHKLRITKVRSLGSSIDCHFTLVDRLLDVAIDQTLTTAQTLNTGVLPSRVSAGILALEANASLAGAGAVVASVSYTNQDGTSGRTATVDTGTSTWPIFKNGTMIYMSLQAGDWGVKSVQSITLTNASSTVGAGKLALTIFDPIIQFDSTIHIDSGFSVGGAAEQEDWLDAALAAVDPSSCLELHHQCALGSTTTGTVTYAVDFEMVID